MASFVDRLLGREKFSQQWNANDPAFAAWWMGVEPYTESVTPYTVLGLSGVLRAVQIISTTIAGLPLKTFEKQGAERVRMPSEFDNPYPGVDGMTPFAWTETMLIHLLLWREAYLWHDVRADGSPGVAYRPIVPDVILKNYRDSQGRRQFEYKDENNETKTVGSETITYIPGPSIDGVKGHPFLWAARAIFSAAISGDKGAQSTLGKGIRLGGLITPNTAEDAWDPEDQDAILEFMRSRTMGVEHAGDLAAINRPLKLQSWTPTNTESQWVETKNMVLGDIERIFGVPPHLLADTEKQTSWGTGVAEQNLSLARYTLHGWSDRIAQVLSLRLRPDQYCEFDYAGLLEGTPEQEIRLLMDQVEKGLLTHAEARKIRNLPPIDWGSDISKEEAETVAELVRAGFDPAAVLSALHLPPMKHLGLPPIAVQKLADAEGTAPVAVPASNGRHP